MRIKIGLFALLLFVSSIPSDAVAESEAASEYFERATDAYRQGEFEEALELLDKASEKGDDLVYRYNRILALQKLNRYSEALGLLTDLEPKLERDERFSEIDKLKAELKKRQRQQRTDAIQMAEAIAERRIERVNVTTTRLNAGGFSEGVISSARRISPEMNQTESSSSKQVEKTSRGRRTEAEIRRLLEGDDSSVNEFGWSLVGIGGLTLTGAALFGSEVLLSDDVGSRIDCYNSSPSDRVARRRCYSGTDRTPADDKRSLRINQNMTKILLGIGTVSMVGGAVSFIVEGTGSDTDSDAAASSSNLRMAPVVSGDILGGRLSIRF